MTTTPTTTASGTATENATVPSATVPSATVSSATVPSATVPSEAATTEPTADAVAERLFTSVLGGLEVLSVYLGDRLGWYRSLREEGPATPSELAGRTATAPRYAREWLEQQAVIGLLQVDTTGPERRYTLPDGAAEVLRGRQLAVGRDRHRDASGDAARLRPAGRVRPLRGAADRRVRVLPLLPVELTRPLPVIKESAVAAVLQVP